MTGRVTAQVTGRVTAARHRPSLHRPFIPSAAARPRGSAGRDAMRRQRGGDSDGVESEGREP